ncbi:MAG: oxygenase MpaB family protein [Actinomycetia bacterium]|nr:oxygenase MpaB family protein [Actinomycetes bacterium]
MPISRVRRRVGMALRAKVAGENPSARAARVWGVEGPRWFTPADPIWRVHEDAAMFPGGIRSLLLQSLHPLAMAGVEDHSDYRSEPWVRVSNTSFFIAQTTFGTIENAERLIAAIRAMHERVVGETADGRSYAASDPHLLTWVHVAEIETFLTCYQTFSPRPLSPADADTYVAQTAHVARLLGVLDPPLTVRQLHKVIEDYRPELEVTDAARRAAHFLLEEPPVSGLETLGYQALASAAVRTLPPWARSMLGLRTLPVPDRLALRTVGRPTVAAVRWLLSDAQVAQDRVIGHASTKPG